MIAEWVVKDWTKEVFLMSCARGDDFSKKISQTTFLRKATSGALTLVYFEPSALLSSTTLLFLFLFT